MNATGPQGAGTAVEPSASEPSIELRAAAKNFGAVRALRRIDIRLGQGEVVGLVGDNGAGKSTLAKILSGALHPDAGELLVDGSRVNFGGVRDGRRFGIEMLYQDLALCDDLDIAENFFAGREPTRLGLLRGRGSEVDGPKLRACAERSCLEVLDSSCSTPIRSSGACSRSLEAT